MSNETKNDTQEPQDDEGLTAGLNYRIACTPEGEYFILALPTLHVVMVFENDLSFSKFCLLANHTRGFFESAVMREATELLGKTGEKDAPRTQDKPDILPPV